MIRRILAMLLVLAAAARGDGPTTQPADGDVFRVVVLPDTQVYSWGFPEVFRSQTEWIAKNAKSMNIVFVSHVGDVVDGGGSPAQWANAGAAMQVLDEADVPYGILPGNHDWARTGDRTTNLNQYLRHFGPKRFKGRDWYGGFMPDRPGNSFQLFSGGSMTFLHIALEWRHDFNTSPDLGVLEWANEVVARHPGLPTIVTTHEDLRDAEPDGTGGGVMAPGKLLFDDLIRDNSQVFLVLSGHNHFGPNRINGDGEWRTITKNAAGQDVHRLMTTFQDWRPAERPSGGEGFLRILTFDVAAGRVHVQTYSPLRDEFLKDAEGPTASDFVLEVNFEAWAARVVR
jgi:hypothetical protein